MNFVDLADELSGFGISFHDEVTAEEALQFLTKKYSWTQDDIFDQLFAYMTNIKSTVVTKEIITELFDKPIEIVGPQDNFSENIPPVDVKPKIVPIKKEVVDHDVDMIEDCSKAYTVAAKLEDKITVNVVLQPPPTFEVVANALYCDSGYDDAFDMIKPEAGDEIEMTGRLLSIKANSAENVAFTSRKYGNYHLKLDNLENEYIFDHMEITLNGTTDGNHLFNPVRIVSPEPTPNAPVVSSLKLLNEFSTIMVVCGPFNQGSTLYPVRLQRAFTFAKSTGVKLLIVFGPVLNLSTINDPSCSDVQTIFNSFLATVSDLAGDSIEVVIVPANDNDPFVISPQYPTKAYESTYTFPQIHLVNNPSIFIHQGLQIAVTNFDTVFALSRNTLLSKAELPATDRLKFYVDQMLKYGHICPSYSRPNSMIDNKFFELPTIFISPSKLPRLAFTSNNVFFVNLPRMGKNGTCTIKPNYVESNGEILNLGFETTFLAS